MSAKSLCTVCYMYWLIHFNLTLLATAYRNDWYTLTSNCLFSVQSISTISIKSPIKKLLVSINQSNSGNWFPFVTNFLREREKQTQMLQIKDNVCRYWVFCIFLSFTFKENQVFNEEETLHKKLLKLWKN